MKQCSRARPIAIAAALCAAASACDTGVEPPATPDAAEISPKCMEATDHSDLEWLQQKVFTPTCSAFSSCHMGAAPAAGGLNLEAGMTETDVVNVESQLVDGLGKGPMNLVEPGSCDDSYMIVILRGEPKDLIDPSIGTMPYGNPQLCDQKIDAVCRWIESL